MNLPQTLSDVVRPTELPPELVLQILADLGHLCLLAPETRIGLPSWLDRLPPSAQYTKALVRELRALRGHAKAQRLDDGWLLRMEIASLAAVIVLQVPASRAQQVHYDVPGALVDLCRHLDARDLSRFAGRADRAQRQGLGGQLPWRCVLRQAEILQPPGNDGDARALLADLRAGQLRKTQAQWLRTVLAERHHGWDRVAELAEASSPSPVPPEPPYQPTLFAADTRPPAFPTKIKALAHSRLERVQAPPPADSRLPLAVLVLRAELLASTAAVVVEHPQSPLAAVLFRGATLFAQVAAQRERVLAPAGWGASQFLQGLLASHLQRARVYLELVARRRSDLELQAALETADAELVGMVALVTIAVESRQMLLHDADMAEADAWWSMAHLAGRVALQAPWPQSAVNPCGNAHLAENDTP